MLPDVVLAIICELIMKNIKSKNPKACDGSTLLHEAAKATQNLRDHLHACKVLVENGADKNLIDSKGKKPIAYAISPIFQYLSQPTTTQPIYVYKNFFGVGIE